MRWLSAIFLIIVIVLGLGFVKFGQIQAAIAFAETFPEPSASVKSTYAESSQYTKTIKVIGQVQAPQTVMVSNEYAGVITRVGFNPGDVVEKGQVLLALDTRRENAELDSAKARHTLAKKTYARLSKLLKENRISQDEVDRAEADVAIAKASIDNLSTVIAKKTIKAPFTGRADLTQFQVGQLLDVNSQITNLIGLTDNFWVDFSVPQTLPQLVIGDKVTVVISAAGSDTLTLTANVIAKEASVNANSRQQKYRAAVRTADGQLAHNQIVNVIVPIAQQDVVMVPTNAVSRNHFGNFVYQLIKDEKGNWRAKAIEVELGERVNNSQVVLAGLEVNTFIATEGAFKLKEGLLVYTQAPVTTALVGGK